MLSLMKTVLATKLEKLVIGKLVAQLHRLVHVGSTNGFWGGLVVLQPRRTVTLAESKITISMKGSF